MVTEATLARTVKTIASKAASKNKLTTEWIADFAGISKAEVREVIRWLQVRNLIGKTRRLRPDAKASVKDIIATQSTFLDVLGNYATTKKKLESGSTDAKHAFTVYYQCVGAASSRAWNKYRIPTWASQSLTLKQMFAKVAEEAKNLDAKILEFIKAQFKFFENLSARLNRFLIPQPHQLYGANAVSRFVQHKADLEDQKSRQATPGMKVHTDFKYQEMRLKSLAKFNACNTKKILLSMPAQFSQEFLKQKGVWRRVRDKYREGAVDLLDVG